MIDPTSGANIKYVLSDVNRKVGESRNLLTRLWRTTLFDLNIGPKTFNGYVQRYLNDPNSGIGDSTKDKNNHRGNLMKELGSNEISYRVFDRALRVIEVEEFELVLRLKRKDRITGEYVYTEHSVVSRNNIQRQEQVEDLANAKIIKGFSAAAMDALPTNKSDNDSKDVK